MKKLILLVGILLLAIVTVSAQAPQKFNYQAVARNSSGVELVNQNIGVRLSILDGSQGGPVVYQETQTVTTNAFGLFTLKVGNGTVLSGVFSGIAWGAGSKFIKTEIDPAGGNNYVVAGTSELISVPYALYAENSPVGPTGPTGVPGSQGIQGATGAQGIQGIQGPAGPTGNNGQQGLQGATGAQGPAGPQGQQGLQGPTGVGVQGATGNTGSQGPTGPQGEQGLVGLQGPTGSTGLPGTIGLQGPTGPTGNMGTQGPTGPAGADGIDGVDGLPGVAGPTGANGIDGIDGLPGAVGPTGPAGANGINGLDGATGDVGPTGPTGLQGPTGPAGADGINGLDGATGPAGADGVTGATGATGPAGPAGTSLGFSAAASAQTIPPTTTTTKTFGFEYHDVGNNFDPSTEHFTAPEAGIYHFDVIGNMFGLGTGVSEQVLRLVSNIGGTFALSSMYATSSYSMNVSADIYLLPGQEVWVEFTNATDMDVNFYGGTFNGHKVTGGVDGADGATGLQGPTGPAGVDGLNGTPGAQGPTGPAGADGINGTPGAQGPTGDVGPTGPTGLQGPTGPAGSGGGTNYWDLTGDVLSNNSGLQLVFGTGNTATGDMAIALGGSVTAGDHYAVALGNTTSATGFSSTAFGLENTAGGNVSTAFGAFNTAGADVATAWGYSNTAPSYAETVLGTFATNYSPFNATAINSDDRLFTIGNGTDDGNRHNAFTLLKNGNIGLDGVENPTHTLHLGPTATLRMENGAGVGYVLTSDGDGVASWQPGTGASLDAAYDNGGPGNGRFIVADAGAVKIDGTDGLIVKGTFGSGAPVELSGEGTRMFFNPLKAAFRAGNVQGDAWDNANIGNYSYAAGYDNKASGDYSTAMGASSVASNNYSTAIGLQATASGMGSTATGMSTIASGDHSTAMGISTTAGGSAATAFGNQNTASGNNAMVAGNQNTASGNSSIALGVGNTAPSYAETVLGSYATTYSPNEPNSHHPLDRVFSIGVGTGPISRQNALTVLKTGNVGIGIDAPTEKLHVVGNARFNNNVNVGQNVFVTGGIAVDNGIMVNGGDITLSITSAILSSKFGFSKPMDNVPGPSTPTAFFDSHGGSVLLIISGSGFAGSGHQVIGVGVTIDSNDAGELKVMSNESSSHKSFSNTLVLNNLSAGSHQIRLVPFGNTTIDFNDFFNVTVIEIPNQ